MRALLDGAVELVALALPAEHEPAVAPALADFAAATPLLPVAFASLGCFPTAQGVVFLAPVVTRALLALHARFHAAFAPLTPPGWDDYQPDQWVPHCTLTLDMPPERLPAALDLCRRRAALPLAGRFEQIGVVEFRPVAERCRFPLAGA